MTTPVFAVVGHPNKGKSSLVATLARDDSVRIGAAPGTTTRARRFPMQVNGNELYVLVDTPGFQRSRGALDWMRRHETDAASRPAVVARFVRQHAGGEAFADECELLAPVVDGAGIIYVVDGARPYGPEYEAEMEILRWTGRPSMAIINPIGAPRFVDRWRDALGQFFRVVRVLDVVQAPFDQQIELLRAFGQLDESWRSPLETACKALIADRALRRTESARVIGNLLAAILSLSVTRDIGSHDDAAPHRARLEEDYHAGLRRLERRARAEVESIYGHGHLDRRETDMELLDRDLLSKETWLAFGLRRRDLMAVGAAGGAVIGGVADASLLGASFLTGTLVGAAVGGALGWWTSDRLADIKVLHQPLGGQRLRVGPTRNVNFPFVVLGRARLHHDLVAGRTHAQRGSLDVDAGESRAGQASPLSDARRRELGRLFERLRGTTPGSERHELALGDLIRDVEKLLEDPVA